MIRRLLSISAAAILAVSCSSPSTTETNTSTSAETSTTIDNAAIQVVTSTQIWADVAEKVLPDAAVEPIVSGQDTDPHSFEPTAADLAKAKEADLVIVGGGGYDAWLYEAVDEDKIVHILPLTEGHDHGHTTETGHSDEHNDEEHDESADAAHGDEHEHSHEHGSNEHIWFDGHAVEHVAEDIAAKAKSIEPNITTNPDAVVAALKPGQEIVHTLPNAKVAQTHPIADLLVSHSDLEDLTPEGYHQSAVNESEPTAADVAAFLELIQSGGIEVLIDSPQTATDTTKRIREAAEQQGIKIVEVYEMPSQDENFFDYYNGFAQRLADATK